MSKFVSSVLESVVKECRTVMLIKDMDISRLMVYAQQIEKPKNNQRERENKKATTSSFNFTQPKSEGGNRSQFHPKSSIPSSALSQCSSYKVHKW